MCMCVCARERVCVNEGEREEDRDGQEGRTHPAPDLLPTCPSSVYRITGTFHSLASVNSAALLITRDTIPR